LSDLHSECPTLHSSGTRPEAGEPLNFTLEGNMPVNYSAETLSKATALIHEKFQVSPDYAQRLAVAALNGIDAHGLDPSDWSTIEETVRVVVASWVIDGAFI
jgi:hypothetical protein